MTATRGLRCVSCAREESAFDESDAHRLQIIGTRDVEHRLRLLARFGLRPPLDGERSVGRAGPSGTPFENATDSTPGSAAMRLAQSLKKLSTLRTLILLRR